MARGPMAPVVDESGAVPEADVRAIAAYVGSETEQASPGAKRRRQFVRSRGRKAGLRGQPISPPPMADADAGESGARIYASACATCHEAGRPVPFGGINLALSTAIQGPTPHNVVNVTLYGLPPGPASRAPIMPGFRAQPDRRAARGAASTYLRAASPASRPGRTRLRSSARRAQQAAPPLYPSPGSQAAPANPSLKGAAW